MKNVAGLIFLIFLIAPAPFAFADQFESDKEEAKSLFLKAVEGDRRSLRSAMKMFKSLKKRNSDDPVVAAYIGACTSLQGRDASLGQKKMRFAESAIKQIDKVMARLPEETEQNRPVILEAKLVAANTYIHLPVSFNRLDKGERLIREILDNRGFVSLPTGMKSAVYRTAAESARKRNDPDARKRYLEMLTDMES